MDESLYDEMIQAQILEEIANGQQMGLENENRAAAGRPAVTTPAATAEERLTTQVTEPGSPPNTASGQVTLPNMENFPPPLQSHEPSQEPQSNYKKLATGMKGFWSNTKKNFDAMAKPL